MKLIAKKPCSFGGRRFYIGDDVPEELVADPAMQEKLGVIIVRSEVGEMKSDACSETIRIAVENEFNGENEQVVMVLARPEEIQQVFSVMQMNAEEGAKVIAGVTSENVLILLHAADSRKMIKNAAKERADRLFSGKDVLNESTAGNEGTDTNMEGAGT